MSAGGAGWRSRARMLSTSRVRARGAHDVGAAGTAVERLGTGRLDRLQPVLLNRREHLDPSSTVDPGFEIGLVV